MEAPIIIEILDRFGKVKERHKIKQFPITIGRSYRNDIIIDDNYISPQHIELKLDENNRVAIHDLQSKNGTFTLSPITRQDIIPTQENLRIRIGHTDIRIRSEAFSIRDTYEDHGLPSRWHFIMTTGIFMPVAFFLLAGVLFLDAYLQTTSTININRIISAILPILIIVSAWSFIWSVVSKIVTHRFYFTYHLMLVSLLLFGFYFIETSFEYIEFIFPMGGIDTSLTVISDLAFTGLLLYGHLHQSTHFTAKKTKQVASVTAAIIVSVAYLVSFVNEPEFESQPIFSEFIKPPMFAVSKTSDLETFFSDIDTTLYFENKKTN